ncbi:MAG TPA: ABC transporter substrate-binding protein [Chloroflexota bacterium]|nr:ABC transporter substrate-binding protein [Chloroflexota bacterium]
MRPRRTPALMARRPARTWCRAALAGALLVGALAVACAPASTPTSAPAAATQSGTAGAAASGATAATAPPTPIHLIANYSAQGPGQSGVWLAYEGGNLRENGLDVELTHVSATPRIIPAMIAGEVNLSGMDPGASILASFEGIDLALLFAGTNRPAFSVVTQPTIRRPEDLRGKSLGISRLGASTHTSALLALSLWGLQPDRDVAFRQLGESSAMIAAMEANQLDAAMLGVPYNAMARRMGYNELLNLATQGPEYPTVTVNALRSWVSANEEALRRFARAYIQGRQRLLDDKPWAIEVFRKYLEMDDPEALDEFYEWVSQCCPRIPYVSEEGVGRLMADLAKDEPRLAGHQPSEWIDSRFLREAEAMGAGSVATP